MPIMPLRWQRAAAPHAAETDGDSAESPLTAPVLIELDWSQSEPEPRPRVIADLTALTTAADVRRSSRYRSYCGS